MYKFFNNNPYSLKTGDCVVRALSKLFDQSWDKTYTDLSLTGYSLGLMPSNNAVHIAYLNQYGYTLHDLPINCPKCTTVREFSKMYPKGRYFLASGDHVVTLIDGDYYDIFDSGDEIVAYYFSKT